MTYLAQDGLLDFLTAGPGPEFFIGKTIELKVEAERIAATWPQGQVDYPIDAAIAIVRTVSDALSTLNSQIRKLVERDVGLITLYTMSQIEIQGYSQKIGSCISDAKRSGAQVARCPNLRSATITALNNIVKHYETISQAEYGLNSNAVLNIKESFEAIREIMYEVGKGVVEGFEKITDKITKPIGALADLIKWGSIGGGLFILYWYVLRPADKRKSK
jgi:hypothetical protein